MNTSVPAALETIWTRSISARINFRPRPRPSRTWPCLALAPPAGVADTDNDVITVPFRPNPYRNVRGIGERVLDRICGGLPARKDDVLTHPVLGTDLGEPCPQPLPCVDKSGLIADVEGEGLGRHKRGVPLLRRALNTAPAVNGGCRSPPEGRSSAIIYGMVDGMNPRACPEHRSSAATDTWSRLR